MDRSKARFAFLGVCIVLAVLLLTKTIRPLTGSLAFAAALALFGLISRGFRSGPVAKEPRA